MRERITIVTCTADSASPLFIKHRKALFKYTENFEWLVIDNRQDLNFNHAREINRALHYSLHQYMLFLDDDVLVKENWLEELIKSAKGNKAAVTGAVHIDESGKINHAGAMVHLSGRTRHFIKELKEDAPFPYVCSAVFLLDMKQIESSGIVFDENYRKYHQETDFCLQLWEKGLTTICSAQSVVNHLSGATAGSLMGHSIAETDLKSFCEKWTENKRLDELLKKYKFLRGGFFEMSVYHQAWSDYLDASALSSIEIFQKVLLESKNIIDFECGQELYGGACFHLAVLLKDSSREEAVNFLQESLKYIPCHRKARELFDELSSSK